MLSSVVWDLKLLSMWFDIWIVVDVVGFLMMFFVVKVVEVEVGEIRYVLRVIFCDDVLVCEVVWLVRYFVGGDMLGGILFGVLLWLKVDFVIFEHWMSHAKAIVIVAKRYGLYVVDIGMDFYVVGEPNTVWNDVMFCEVSIILLLVMEFVDLGVVTCDPCFLVDSMAVRWN